VLEQGNQIVCVAVTADIYKSAETKPSLARSGWEDSSLCSNRSAASSEEGSTILIDHSKQRIP